MSKKLNYRIINLTFLFLLLYILASNIELWLGIISKVTSICAPFIIAFIFAYAFSPLVNKLEKKKIKRKYAVGIVLVFLLLILFTILSITLPMFYEESMSLIKMIGEGINNIIIKYDLNLLGLAPKIQEFLNEAAKDITTLASTTTIGLLTKSVDFLGKLLVGFISFVYFLADMDKIRGSVKKYLKEKGEKTYNYIKLLDKEIYKYINGMAIFMLIQCIEYTLLFFIIGHPNFLILGLLAGLTNIVPYFGGIFTNILAIITASVVSTPLMIATIVIFIIFSQIDCYYISPKVYGKTNNVNALVTIMVVSIGGSLAGVIGIVTALPIYLLLRETYKYFRSDFKKGISTIKETIKEE